MCLIIHRPPRNRPKHLPRRIVEYNRGINPDGFGLAFRDGKKLVHYKFGPAEFSAFDGLLRQVDETNVEYVAHFRKATHGAPCRDLSHPFAYRDPSGEQVIVFHNGVINISTDHGESDTSQFVKDVLAYMPPKWWKNRALKYLVEENIGWSRLLVMTKDETVRINGGLWDHIGSFWYSTYPEPKQAKVVTRTGAGWTNYSGKGWSKLDESADRYKVIDDDDEEEALVRSGIGVAGTGLVIKGDWYQNGHPIRKLNGDSDDEGDTYGQASCETCGTVGDYYIIDGKLYLDVAHDEGNLLLPSGVH